MAALAKMFRTNTGESQTRLSCREALFGEWKAATIAAALTISLLLGSAVEAGEVQQTPLPHIRVPHGLLVTKRVDTTRTAVGLGTKKLVALVYYGNDPKHIEQSQQAIEKLRAQKWPAVLLIADASDEGVRNAYDVFIDQERWVPFGDDLSPVHFSAHAGELESAVRAGYARYSKIRIPAQTSSPEQN